MLQLYIQRKIQ